MTEETPNQHAARLAGYPTTAAWIVSLATRMRAAQRDLADTRTEIARLETLIDAHTCPKETQP